MWGKGEAYTGEHLRRTPEEKRPSGRPSHRWEDNIKIDLQEFGFGGMDWIDLLQDKERWL